MKPTPRRIHVSAASFAAAIIGLAAVPLRADTYIPGHLDVEKNINFGTTNASPPTSGVALTYGASATSSRFTLSPDSGEFRWRQNGIGTLKQKMLLNGDNILTLYSTAGAANIVLNPNNGQINLTGTGSGIYSNGSAVFTVNSSGNLVFANRPFAFSSTTSSTSSTTGALTVSGGIGVATDSFINGIRIGRAGGNNASNLAFGVSALNSNSSGLNNTASGYYSLRLNSGGSGNTAVGRSAMEFNTSGSNNLAAGHTSLYANSTGSNNVALGQNAGRYLGNGQALTAPESSVYIGANSRGYSNNDENSIVIGASAVGEGSNTTVIGNSSTTKTHLFGETVVNSLSVTSATVLNGQVTLAAPQGDISMGIYGN